MRRGRVLLIEPDEAIARLFAQVLEEDSYTVVRTSGPQDAVRQLCASGRERFDLVLSAPCTNPHVAPYGWLDRLRTCASVPIVICSRWPGTFYADHGARGFAAVLAEPCDLDDLIALVASLCTGAREHGCPDARTRGATGEGHHAGQAARSMRRPRRRRALKV